MVYNVGAYTVFEKMFLIGPIVFSRGYKPFVCSVILLSQNAHDYRTCKLRKASANLQGEKVINLALAVAECVSQGSASLIGRLLPKHFGEIASIRISIEEGSTIRVRQHLNSTCFTCQTAIV